MLRESSGVSSVVPSAVFHTSFCLTWAMSFQGSLARVPWAQLPYFTLFYLKD